MYRLALLSMHGCPLARLGERETGGMNVYVLQTAKELGRRGHLVDVFTRTHEPGEPPVIDLGDGVRVIHLDGGPYDVAKENLYGYVPEFLGNVRRFRESEAVSYDLVHSHYWLSGCVGARLSEEWEVPHVATFHTLARTKMRARAGESESRRREVAELEIIRDVDAVVVSTDQEREDVARLYRVSTHKVRVIPAGVDLDLFKPIDKAHARRKLGLAEGRIVLSVGRIEPLKGLDILITAMAGIEDRSDVRLVIVGGDLERDRELARLRMMVGSLGLSEMVTFTGAVEHERLPEYYSAADVFVLPSYYESFGLVALEAMACGTPVIASRVGGPRTFVTGSVTGYLIPWHCPEPYARCLEMLLANPFLRDSMGRSAMQTAQGMGWGRVAEGMLDLYSTHVAAGWSRVAGA